MIDLTVSGTVFGVPRSHRHCTLQNFRWPSEGVQNAVLQFMEAVATGKKKNFLFFGSTGLGKTHLAVALYRWGVYRWGTSDCAFFKVTDFFSDVKNQFDIKEGKIDYFRDVEDARKVVVLDDILGRNPSAWELDNVIFRLIDLSYSNLASTVVTTNYTLDQMATILKPHEISRLLDRASLIEFVGKDQRVSR